MSLSTTLIFPGVEDDRITKKRRTNKSKYEFYRSYFFHVFGIKIVYYLIKNSAGLIDIMM